MKPLTKIAFAVAALASGTAAQAEVAAGAQLLESKCALCHVAKDDGTLSRISEQRKTPEGWDMTLARMGVLHGVKLTPEERHGLVKYLSDTQGLAPSETDGLRYIIEREPAVVESPPNTLLAEMCARCHSWARVGLQRRTQDEWTKHVHFHVGQYPTIEYQALARDRDWFEIALNEVVPALAESHGLENEAWTKWQAQDKADVSGTWHLFGEQPGRGSYHGKMTVTSTDAGYGVTLDMQYASGEQQTLKGNAVVYNGYEWRARLGSGDNAMLQVFAVGGQGSELSGRWFMQSSDAVGGRLRAVKAGAESQVLGASPAYVRVGESQQVTFYGGNLDSVPALGEGVTLSDVSVAEDGASVTAKVTVAADAAVSQRANGLFSVYQQVDSVRVEPAHGMARVGGDGGTTAKVPAQFSAVAYANGADGKSGTDDDVRIGVMNATWQVDDANDIAKSMKDAHYAGKMDAARGLFTPAAAGLNTERRFSTNNAGDLKVVATVEDGDRKVSGEGKLLVTVQRWNDPPIR